MSIYEKDSLHRFEDIRQDICPGRDILSPAVRDCKYLRRGRAADYREELESPIAADDSLADTAKAIAEHEIAFIKARRAQEGDILRFYQTLIKRCPKYISQELMPLEQAQQRVLCRLVTVYFLKTGEPGESCSSCPYICSIPYAIRNLCNEESSSVDEYLLAGSEYRHIRHLCEEIAQIKADSSHELEMLLGKILHR